VLGIYAAISTGTPNYWADAEFWGKVHCALTFVGLNDLHAYAKLMGMNRIAEYDPKFESLNFLCTMGSYLLAVSTFPFIINAIWSWMYGPKAGNNPWDALSLEWMTTSPPAIENFDKLPVVATGPL